MPPPAKVEAVAIKPSPVPINVLPPVEYDNYTGLISITVAKSKEELRRLCNNTVAQNPLGLGCAWKNKPITGACWIIHAPVKDIIEAGYTLKLVIRHERGHCATPPWPGHHPGARVPTAADR